MSKLNELGLHIDTTRLYNDLIEEFTKVILNIGDELERNMKTRARNPVVIASIKAEITKLGSDEIEIIVGSDHWQSFLDNYGMGSLMAKESENPYLSEYKKSNFWNSFRYGNAIVGRPQGVYIVPNWESGDGYIPRKSSGNLQGVNLENLKWGNNYNLTSTPQPPSFFLEFSIRDIKAIMEEQLLEVYEKFPFSKYIKGGA